MRYSIKAAAILIFALFITACQQEDLSTAKSGFSLEETAVLSSHLDLPQELYSYGFGNIEQSELLDYKATLGRVLFYDNLLSVDGSVSCGSCHDQSLAFADNKAFSHGANGNLTKRNSIALGSVRSFGIHYEETGNDKRITPGLFWDDRASSIREQLRETINNPNEMGMSLDEITSRVNQTDYYAVLSNKAFGTTKLDEDAVLEALEVFIKSINSTNTVFESEALGDLNYITGDSIVGETDLATGFQLFESNCNSCHSLNLSLHATDVKEKILTANNGLLLADNDQGVYEHTQKAEDKGKFKVPGLRNISLTAPYMHDGRFSSLEEVVDFYNSGINSNPNLHPTLTSNGAAKKMNFTELEKTQLIQFLESLTDVSLATEDKWSNPFK